MKQENHNDTTGTTDMKTNMDEQDEHDGDKRSLAKPRRRQGRQERADAVWAPGIREWTRMNANSGFEENAASWFGLQELQMKSPRAAEVLQNSSTDYADWL